MNISVIVGAVVVVEAMAYPELGTHNNERLCPSNGEALFQRR